MVNIRRISRDLKKITHEELNETPKNVRDGLQELKQFVEQTPHLKARTDDQFLIAFLRSAKFDIERAKYKLDLFYTCRTALPELMSHRDPLDDKLLEVIRLGVGLPLPVLETPNSPRILLIRPGAFDPTRFTMVDIHKVANMINDILIMEDDNFVIAGNISIVDFKDVTKTHLLQLNPVLIQKLALMNQDAMPYRQKGFHFANTPPGFDVIFNLFKTIVVSNGSQREDLNFFIHPNTIETIYDHIPKRCLPAEYGGTAGTLESIAKHWEEKLISYRNFFREDEAYGTDESKRVQRLHSADILFAPTGLQID